uniref:Uncharacterized protein n=1 Tax=Anguilla anguilla TaxID=7936 RepID=A0A0E9SSP0_ANGAN
MELEWKLEASRLSGPAEINHVHFSLAITHQMQFIFNFSGCSPIKTLPGVFSLRALLRPSAS